MQASTEWALRMNESIDFADENEVKKFLARFATRGEFQVGVRRHTAADRHNLKQMEIGPQGLVTMPNGPAEGLAITYGGTPHHVPGLIGYWHINDVDELYFRTQNAEGGGMMCILERRHRPGEGDMFAWYCQQCHAMLHCYRHESGNQGFGFYSLWEGEHKAVSEFNGDRTLRVCWQCGLEHPLAYRYWAANNSKEEEACRHLW